MIHMNIRSAHANLNTFDTYLNTIDYTFPIIALSESWLTDSNVNLYKLEGYEMEHNVRKAKMEGVYRYILKIP